LKQSAFVLGFILILASCATNPAMSDFPSRRIDRDLSNSSKVTSWSVIAAGRSSRLPSGETSNTTPIPWPLYFTKPAVDNAVPLFDQALIEWSVPFRNEDENFAVLSVGWSPASDAIFGYNNQVNLGITRRQTLDRDLALDYGVGVTDAIYSTGLAVVVYRVEVGTELQVSDFLWIKPEVSAEVLNIPPFSTTVGNTVYSTASGISTQFPVGFEIAIDPSKVWGVRGGYSFSGLGRTDHTWDQQYYVGESLNY